MGKKRIRRTDFEDFEILEEVGDKNEKKPVKVGTVRVKPSGILWKPAGKQSWFGVSVQQFADFAEASGKLQEK